MKSLTIAVVISASIAMLGGCASSSPAPAYDSATNMSTLTSMNYGVIDTITVTRAPAQTNGSGALIGGLVGGALGNQIGSGNGRTAATVAGAVGGAMVGNRVEADRNASGPEMFQIGIRLDNGDYRTVMQDSIVNLSVGNRVRVVDGRVYRY